MVSQKYRWDFIGLSTDEKPTSETSDKVVNGSTYYCSDTSKLYVYCDGTWYERKPLGGGGGTSNFDQLTNRPKYNGSEMTSSTDIPEVKTYTAGSNISISAGNEISATDTKYTAGTNVSISDQNVISATDTTYTHFTGATASTDGVQGLVPGPLAGDEDKFLKADGTWDTVQAGSSYTAGDGINISAQDVISATNTGKAKILTTADYNANSSNWSDTDPANFNCVASWKLESGLYCVGENSLTFYDSRTRPNTLGKGTLIVAGGDSTTNNRRCILLCLPGNATITKVVNQSDGSLVNVYTMVTGVINNLVSTSTTDALSANQGKVLKDLVDSLAIRGAGAPTTTTVGQVGTLYEDTTNGDLYICTDATNPYTWEEVGAGGGGPTVVQTTGTSTTDVMSQNAVTSMVFADPSDRQKVQIGAGASASNGITSIAIGNSATTNDNGAIALGRSSSPSGRGSVAIGAFATTPSEIQGVVGFGSTNTAYGYNSSNYRLLTGLYDPQSAHDAATKGYVDGIATMGILTTSPTGTTAGVPGRLYTYDTGGGSYEVYLCVHDNGDNTYIWKQVSLI